MKGHSRLLLSNGCDNNCRGKRSKQVFWLYFFFFLPFCSQALDQKKSESCSCRSKRCAFILGHPGRTVANLGIKKLAAAPLNSIKSSSELLLPINEGIYYWSKRWAGSQGWEQVGSGELCSSELREGAATSSPTAASLGPGAASGSLATGCFSLETAPSS